MAMIVFDRFICQPSRHTFSMPPVRRFLDAHMDGGLWADPFAGSCSPASWHLTNDLDPGASAEHHMEAEDFARSLADSSLDGVLFDPPYSPRQISECYKAIGRAVAMRDTQNSALYARVRSALIPKIKPGGKVIRCGWNSVGFGRGNGFELLHVRLICHGAAHNDTILTCERKAA